MRLERDSMGSVEVPSERRYGAQTARAVANFPIAVPGLTLGDLPTLVQALLQVKQAAARANRRRGYLDEARADLIERACAALISEPDLSSDFPVHVLHGGGGTSGNMNANEVVAHAANALGAHSPTVDPLDHVNKNQSTNDVYPTACRLALISEVEPLTSVLLRGESVLADLAARFADVPRLARTCLQDTVATTFGTFFGAYLAAWNRHRRKLDAVSELLHQVNLGGGLAGQPNATPAAYRDAVVDDLRNVAGRPRLSQVSDFADAAQNPDDPLTLAHAIDGLARTLIKQSQDLRILASGPEGGLAEIRLPPLQPGSSAVPGKVNPVIPEFVIQCSMQAVASAAACGHASDRGDLDLNVWEGIFVHNLSTALALLASAVTSLIDRGFSGLEIDEDLNRTRAAASTAKIAKLVQTVSYAEAQRRLEDDLAGGAADDAASSP